MPEHAEPWEDIMQDLDRAIVPGLTNWEANRRFFAYFKPHSSYPAVLGEMLCAGLNVMGFDWYVGLGAPWCVGCHMMMMVGAATWVASRVRGWQEVVFLEGAATWVVLHS